MLHKITKILSVTPYSLICQFNTQEIRKIDLTQWVNEFKNLNNNWTSKLADPNFFKTVRVADYGTLVWQDDIDLDPEVLYRMSSPAMAPAGTS